MIGYCVVRPQCHEFCVECLFVHVSPGGGGFGGGGGGRGPNSLCTKNGTTAMPEQWVMLQNCGSEQAFFVIRGEGGGGGILEEAGTFSGQALLLSYPYPRGGGGSSQGGRHPLTALSTVPTQYQTTRNASNHFESIPSQNLSPAQPAAAGALITLAPKVRTQDLWAAGVICSSPD